MAQLGPGGWAVRAAPTGDTLVAVIDGTNLAVRSSRASPGDNRSAPERFSAWLGYLRAVTGAAVTLVAFDNKGSAAGAARAALAPGYNRARYRRQRRGGSAAAGSAAAGAADTTPAQGGTPPAPVATHLPGWAHLDGITRTAGCHPVHAVVGYEADDVMAAAAAWVGGGLMALMVCGACGVQGGASAAASTACSAARAAAPGGRAPTTPPHSHHPLL